MRERRQRVREKERVEDRRERGERGREKRHRVREKGRMKERGERVERGDIVREMERRREWKGMRGDREWGRQREERRGGKEKERDILIMFITMCKILGRIGLVLLVTISLDEMHFGVNPVF